jgi:hypothetical protein
MTGRSCSSHVTDVNTLGRSSFFSANQQGQGVCIGLDSGLDIGDMRMHSLRKTLRHGYSSVAELVMDSVASPRK